jgi:4-phosphopantoate--beta-alanine ligase
VLIPKTHPRATSLHIRENIVLGFRNGLVVEEGLLAHGRGEMFDYLIGEKTSKTSHEAINAAARVLLTAKYPVISVNGNFAALCSKEIVELSNITGAKIEINLFYASKKRKEVISQTLKKHGAKEILGVDPKFSKKIPRLDSARRIVDKRGIFSADVILVPLEDGDRTIALKKFGKNVITFDLNPMSRTAQTADITIVDNVIRGMKILINTCKKLSEKDLGKKSKFDNKKNLKKSIITIRKNLRRMSNA